jgi:hypothetical protein
MDDHTPSQVLKKLNNQGLAYLLTKQPWLGYSELLDNHSNLLL